ncbi:hypothetical protein [Aeromonas veronii]|uniref:hypothetical protein n=1 Tax=Aeromonas veronii TaxID=654 RepID=UPI003D1B5AAB
MLNFEERMALLIKRVESFSKEELLKKLASYPAEGPIAVSYLSESKYSKYVYAKANIVYSSKSMINNGALSTPTIVFVDTHQKNLTLGFTFDSTLTAGNDEFYCTGDTISWAA